MAKWGIDELEAHKRLDSEMAELDRCVDYYYEEEKLRVIDAVKAMKSLIPEHEQREYRRAYLADEISRVREMYKEKPIQTLENRLKRLVHETKVYAGDPFVISEEMVATARHFPLNSLMPHKNNVAKCPFHNDKTPSLNIHRNFYYCHGCGEHGDTIKFIMKTKGVSFREAVRLLT